jgi:hypothetical protein
MSCYILKGSDEEVTEYLDWARDLEQIFYGLHLDTGVKRHRTVITLMKDNALTLYNTKATELATQRREELAALQDAADANGGGNAIRAEPWQQHVTIEIVRESLKEMAARCMPKKVLYRSKDYVRTKCRKPRDMKVRVYHQHLTRINTDELPNLPPFGSNQGFTNDELLHILMTGTPNSWKKEMEKQGFDPMNHVDEIHKVVDFMERIESSEDFEEKATKPKAKDNGNDKKKSRTQKSNDSKYFCMFHGNNNTHSTDECHLVKKLVSQSKTSNDSSSRKKVEWSDQASDNRKKSRKELAAFVKKEIAKGVQKTLASKKRKTDDLDLNALEAELSDFNYEDMDNLSLNSKDEDDLSTSSFKSATSS